MASCFVDSYRIPPGSTTSLEVTVVYAGADVAGGRISTGLTVTGLDFANDTAVQIANKIATAVRALTAQCANGSGGTGFTIAANQIVMPGFTKG